MGLTNGPFSNAQQMEALAEIDVQEEIMQEHEMPQTNGEDRTKDHKSTVWEEIPLESVSQTQHIESADTTLAEKEKQISEQCLATNGEFIQGVDRNLKHLNSDYCFPDFNFPAKYRFLPWQIPVKEVIDWTNTHGNLSKVWTEMLIKRNLIDDTDKSITTKFNEIHVYELKNGGISFLIVSAFIVKWEDGRPVTPTAEWMAALHSFKEETVSYAKQRYCTDISAVGLIVGSPVDIPCWKEYQGGANHFTVYCIKPLHTLPKDKESEWMFHFPVGIRGQVWDDFVTHLLPLNLEQLTESLYHALERLWREEVGRLTSKKLQDLWGMDDFLFQKTFWQLQKQKKEYFIIRGNELLKQDPENALFLRNHPLYMSGMRNFVSHLFWEYTYQFINLVFTAIGLFICFGSEANAQNKISTLLVLALMGLISNTLVRLHQRKPWRK